MATNITPNVLVLDFGGVISKTLFETHPDTEAALGLPPGSLQWRGPFDPQSDPLWQRMQNDDISERDYWLERTQETGRLVGASWQHMHQFVQAARGADPQSVIRPEALAAIQAVAAQPGKQLALLSNELDLFYGADFRPKLPFLAEFATIIDATYTHILKPDPRAYQAVCDTLNVSAAHCVMLDDQQRNVHGAIATGMQAVHFNVFDPASSYAEALSMMHIV